MKKNSRYNTEAFDDITEEELREFRKQRTRKIKKKKTRRRLLLVIEFFVLLILSAFAYIMIKYDGMEILDINSNKVVNANLPKSTLEAMKGYTNIAIFGVDARNNTSLTKATHSDMIMVCSINKSTGDIKLVSVYRDTYSSIDSNDEMNKINQAYFRGGPEQAITALNKNLDLNITEYVTVNWKAVADVVNALGGVDIEITDAEFAYINGFITETVEATGVPSVHLASSGMQHLDGIQAVAYARLRLMDTDYKRTERQRKVLELTLQKAKTADLATLLRIVDIVIPQVSTSLSIRDTADLAKNITNYNLSETSGYPFDKESMRVGGQSCVIPQGLIHNNTKLHALLYENHEYEYSDKVKELDTLITYVTGVRKP